MQTTWLPKPGRAIGLCRLVREPSALEESALDQVGDQRDVSACSPPAVEMARTRGLYQSTGRNLDENWIIWAVQFGLFWPRIADNCSVSILHKEERGTMARVLYFVCPR